MNSNEKEVRAREIHQVAQSQKHHMLFRVCASNGRGSGRRTSARLGDRLDLKATGGSGAKFESGAAKMTQPSKKSPPNVI